MNQRLLAKMMFLFAISSTVTAEPWVSTRYAQNCAGCHAPGRKNLPPKERRCTLSCQGCHVNPNGGGLRSAYGKFNEEKWLRSFKLDDKRHDSPAIYKDQKYAKKNAKPNRIYKMRTTEEIDIDERHYDRSDGLEFITAASRAEFERQIPQKDPYRLFFENKIDGGGDVRWQVISGKRESSSSSGKTNAEYWRSFLMDVDLSLRYRPFYKRYNIVYEGRYLGNPTEKKAEAVNKSLNRRSLYLLVDDLPYASFVMAGYYRPLFGNYVADHTALAQTMMSYVLQGNPSIYSLEYQAMTIGASPNVPFANVHLLSKQLGGAPNDTHTGFALNGGGRFVTLGASITYSYWNSQKTVVSANEKVTERVQMQALGGAMRFEEFIIALDFIGFSKDTPNDAFRQGFVGTFETYYRFWREFYLNWQFAMSNKAENLAEGKASQMRLGLRSFLYPGVDYSLHYGIERSQVDAEGGSDTKTSEFLMQLHLFI